MQNNGGQKKAQVFHTAAMDVVAARDAAEKQFRGMVDEILRRAGRIP